MEKILKIVDDSLEKTLIRREEAAKAAQERADLLSAQIERAKKNQVVISFTDNSSFAKIRIDPSGLDFNSRDGGVGSIGHETALELARENPGQSTKRGIIARGIIADILAVALQDPEGVTIEVEDTN